MSGDILWLGWLNFVEIWKVLFLAKLYFGVVQKTLHSPVSHLSPVSNPGCESRQISLLFLLEQFAPPLLQRPVAAKVEGSGFLAVQNFINRKQTRKKYAN